MLIILCCLISPLAHSAETPAGYDDNDYQKLRTFLELSNGSDKNGDKIGVGAGYDPGDPETWGGVTWDTSTPKKGTYIDWQNKGLVGDLDVSGLEQLMNIDCHGNQLTGLDLGGLPKLTELNCKENLLTTLEVAGCVELKNLWCENNQLTFATLPPGLPASGGAYVYAPQADISVDSDGIIVAGEEIDLSAEAEVGEVDTVFTWLDGDGNEIAPITADSGKFVFDAGPAGKTIYCEMTNAALPALTLKTIGVLVDTTHDITFIKPTAANDEDNFNLTIIEGNSEYDKTYDELETELQEDEAKQLHWREAVSEGGHGYVLTMELGTITNTNISETGAQATVPFTIKEQSEDPEIPETTTDTGTIVFEIVKLQGQWLCRTMTITFDTDLIRAAYRAAAGSDSGDDGASGFAFGRFAFTF